MLFLTVNVAYGNQFEESNEKSREAQDVGVHKIQQIGPTLQYKQTGPSQELNRKDHLNN